MRRQKAAKYKESLETPAAPALAPEVVQGHCNASVKNTSRVSCVSVCLFEGPPEEIQDSLPYGKDNVETQPVNLMQQATPPEPARIESPPITTSERRRQYQGACDGLSKTLNFGESKASEGNADQDPPNAIPEDSNVFLVERCSLCVCCVACVFVPLPDCAGASPGTPHLG